MCSSFFAFSPHPLVGMNYDYDRTHPFKIALTDEGRIFCMQMPFGGHYGRPLGVSRDGIAADTQWSTYCEEGLYHTKRPNALLVPQARELVLKGLVPPAEMGAYLETHPLQYHRRRVFLHSLCARRDGTMCVMQPGRPVLTQADFPDGFAVLTNFNLYDRSPINREMHHIACPRYRRAYQMLLEGCQGVERGFAVLEAVRKRSGRLPTIFSLVSELDDDRVYFSLYGDFSRRFSFSFADNRVRTDRGFATQREKKLTRRGIWAEELLTWT